LCEESGTNEKMEKRPSTSRGSKKRLKRFLLRYYPPGIILEYEYKGKRRTKPIDLLDLSEQ